MRACPLGPGSGARRYWSFGFVLLATLAAALAQLVQAGTPQPATPPDCDQRPLFAVSLPDTLPQPLPPAQSVMASPAGGAAGVPPATAAVPTPRAAVRATARPAMPAATPDREPAVPLGSVLRADDPPADHGLRVTLGGLVPLVVPQPCAVSRDSRRTPPSCVGLLAPAARLCADGAWVDGSISAASGAPVIALQAGHVSLRDAAGRLRLDVLQGYVRYDDPEAGLLLICPAISALATVGPSARQFAAPCTNRGVDGWSISGQANDGGGAAPDSVSLTVTAPDGSVTEIVGPLANGAVLVTSLPDEAR